MTRLPQLFYAAVHFLNVLKPSDVLSAAGWSSRVNQGGSLSVLHLNFHILSIICVLPWFANNLWFREMKMNSRIMNNTNDGRQRPRGGGALFQFSLEHVRGKN